MLNFVEDVSQVAKQRASGYARRRFDARGDERKLFLVEDPFEIYGAVEVAPDAFRPERLVLRGLRFAIMDETDVVAFVTVDPTGDEPEAVSMEFAHPESRSMAALDMADESAERDGVRQIRIIQIPAVDARFYWVTGENPQFVDQLKPQVLDEREFINELRARLASKLEPRPDPGSPFDFGT